VTGERWARVKALFQLAVERPIEERGAFLAAATGDDEALRREVESLLTSDTSDESFLRGLPVVPDIRPLLTAGRRIGPYEIVAPIGAGAMGEVYRVRDTKLNRDVALKVLPDSFAGDPDRLARFTREAQTLAALNHPNIAHLHGLEESSGIRALVMELVDGDDLSLRIARGAMPLDEALPIARQIAHALEAAHEQGIIHRDLKPANIKVRADGTVKVLDFGLAKTIEPLSSSAAAAIANSAITSPAVLTRTLLSVAPGEQSLAASPLEQRVGNSRPTRTAVALSPDGKTLVFGTIWGGDQQLYARAMDGFAAMPLPGTIGGSSPFFSPDGQWVGFWAGGKLKKVPLAGGPAVTLCDAASLFGASWGSDGMIVFAFARNGGLWRVPAAGGTPEALTTLQPGEYSHRLPHVLPGGRAVIFTISKGAQLWDDTQIVVRSLDTGQQTVLVTGGSDGRYVSTGHLIYVRLGTLMAVPFDPVRLAVIGGARGVIDDVMEAANRNLSDMENTLSAQFTVSETGALVYLTGGAVPAAELSLAWVDRQGTSQPLAAPLRSYRTPRLAPDQQRVAVSTQQDRREVWSYDVVRGALSPVTADGQSGYGIFSPDGKRVVFRSGAAGGEDNLYWKAADGSGVAERLSNSTRSQTPASWSPDGTTLAFVEEGESTGFFQFDIRVLSIADRKTRAVIQTTANEMGPEFSPDGRWLAYVSNQSGRHEVYVQPYPGPGERHLISTNGGNQPAWNPNGRELFYVQGVGFDGGPIALMSVSVEATPAFRAGTPEKLFESVDLRSAWGRSYDVASDGRRFLMALDKERAKNPPPAQLIFVQHWFEELKRLVPAK
jgi:Tol biopolymer transport system component